jgi:hypothetical protein
MVLLIGVPIAAMEFSWDMVEVKWLREEEARGFGGIGEKNIGMSLLSCPFALRSTRKSQINA